MGQVAHALLTRPPLGCHLFQAEQALPFRYGCHVRLACVRHAASVHPEPGSNSQHHLSRPGLPLSGFLFRFRRTDCFLFRCLSRFFSSSFRFRFACVRHAASVHPEPGSNSQLISLIRSALLASPFLYCSLVVLNVSLFPQHPPPCMWMAASSGGSGNLQGCFTVQLSWSQTNYRR